MEKYFSTMRFNVNDIQTLADGLRQYLRSNTCENQLNNGAELLSKVNTAKRRLERVAEQVEA